MNLPSDILKKAQNLSVTFVLPQFSTQNSPCHLCGLESIALRDVKTIPPVPTALLTIQTNVHIIDTNCCD